jgi:dGTPase
MPPAYDEHDTARRVVEPAKASTLPRSPFERDRARVLHSAALRRLAAKTQVVGVGVDDFPRTRLTHSLECAQIGRELGAALGADPDLVEAACLAHDLGHPPFGHNGEDALDAAAQACGGFEGNAQSLRVLVRLESKVVDGEGRSVGLNLTRAVLDGAVKYPWVKREGTTKYNVYADDREIFDWIRARSPQDRPEARCVEAQIMDWSDDVAYSVHDLEDGIHAGLIPLKDLCDAGERRQIAERAASTYCAEDPDVLADAFGQLLEEPWWPHAYDGTHRSLVALKRLTSELIARFCAAAYDSTRESFAGDARRYVTDLVVPARARAECALLKATALHYVMDRQAALTRQEHQREVVHELVAAIADRAPASLDPRLRADWEAGLNDPARLRVVIDQVASLTDTSAQALHQSYTKGSSDVL